MHFTSSVMPGVRAFAATMRVKLCREPKALARSPFSSSSPSAATALRANWRVCPMTGQLQQRWSFDDSQDPQSRGAALLLQQAGLIFGLYLGARSYP
ncbi:hypothetical protein GV819_11645 [Pseudomonas sp. Fl5BN2]|uniref:hypothetical protein n=1 Tax=unclassified Pseudomonas TaxID=196821 RepID=UPI0013784260|nr:MULTISPECIES: hypothetical protein [unclassified Pseudomonas]NBF02941.1 hypothetical protein [Pseudomonas sp. Fl5BN2]NBF11717.1 hypothetical protein [Pseudomonas sp. Fl4BN1]